MNGTQPQWLLLFLSCALLGCQGKTHAWRNVPDEARWAADDWQAVPASSFAVLAAVDEENREAFADAVPRLQDTPFVEMQSSELAKIHVNPRDQDNGGLEKGSNRGRAYLLRGLAYGGFPMFTRLWYSPSQNAVWVHQGTCNGENLLISMHTRDQIASPVVVYLSQAPTAVYVTCEVGGDRMIWYPPASPRDVR